ncbi:MAG: hypothetical protein RL456_757 [Pseudomonadota bacterium]|jgi:hypothetical protein
MDDPFDSDLMDAMDEADAMAQDDDTPAPGAAFDQGDGFEGFDGDGGNLGGDGMDDAFTDAGDGFESGDALGFDGSEDAGESDGLDDMALWNAFEEEIADGLDAADEDEFLSRVLGGLGRAGGLLSRRLGGAAGIAQRVARGARRVGQVAGQAGRLAGRISPAAGAAARLARLLGAPGLAGGLDRVGRGARTASQWGRQASRMAGHVGQTAAGLGQAAQGGQALMGQLSQLFGGGGNEFDDFDALADLYEDGVDEALPGMVGLAARAAARGLGFRNIAQLSTAGRRALVRGVGAAARELMRGRDPRGIRALPRLAHAAGRTATRTAPTPQAASQAVRRGLPGTARQLARQPQALRQAARPLTRPTSLGRGLSASTVSGPRTLRIDGPATLTITPAAR